MSKRSGVHGLRLHFLFVCLFLSARRYCGTRPGPAGRLSYGTGPGPAARRISFVGILCTVCLLLTDQLFSVHWHLNGVMGLRASYKAWTCILAYFVFIFVVAIITFFSFCCGTRPGPAARLIFFVVMVGSCFVHGLELSFLVHVLGICMVPWDYGSRSLSVARWVDFFSHVLGICMVPWDYGSRSPSVVAVGDL